MINWSDYVKSKNIIFLLISIGFVVSFFFDQQIVLFFQNLRFPLLDQLGVYFSGITEVVIILIFTFLIFVLFKKKFLFQFGFASLVSIGLGYLIKYVVQRPRPFSVMDFAPLVFEDGFSFVSHHTIFVFALVPVFFFVFRKNGGMIWFIFASLVAFSRLYFGVHYLSDVLGAILLGIIIGHLSLVFEKKFFVRWKSLS